MAKSSSIRAALERAAEASRRAILEQTLGELPRDVTLGQLLSEFRTGPYGDALRGLTLGDIASAVTAPGKSSGAAPAPKAKRGGGGGGGKKAAKVFRTRTNEGRAAIDEAVRGYLVQNPAGVRAEDIRSAVGGTPPQIRESLGRLGKLVQRKGQRRATRYFWKGK